jgi:hypothetical protein
MFWKAIQLHGERDTKVPVLPNVLFATGYFG